MKQRVSLMSKESSLTMRLQLLQIFSEEYEKSAAELISDLKRDLDPVSLTNFDC